jgi:hypothetical protein
MGMFVLIAVFYLALMAALYVALANVSAYWRASIQRPMRAGIAVLAVAGLLGCAYAYVTVYAVDAPTLEQGRERAGSLVIALERYKAVEGSYPYDLDVLVPAYLVKIPRPAWRYRYSYRRCTSGAQYVLSIKEVKIPDGSCAYSSYSSEWKCADDLPQNWRTSCNW